MRKNKKNKKLQIKTQLMCVSRMLTLLNMSVFQRTVLADETRLAEGLALRLR
jgi:hypothetical protein